MVKPEEGTPAITIVGLGLMGTAMSQRFLTHGWQVQVWNRTQEKALPLLDLGATWTDQPFTSSPIVLLSLYNSQAVWDVFRQWEKTPWKAQRIIDTTTGSPEEVEPLAGFCHERHVAYMDAPISGSSQQTLAGEATVIVGGSPDDYQACQPIWDVLSRHIYHAGPIGSASKLKLVSNLILGLNRLALAEGLAYAESLGLPMERTLAILKGSAAYSKVMDTKGKKMLERDFSVQARLHQHLKDVQLILASATSKGQVLPTTMLHEELLRKGVELGLADLDNSAIFDVIRGRAT